MSSGTSSPHIDTSRSSRSALEVELVDKIDLSNDLVSRRLDVDQVPDDLDQNCCRGQDPIVSVLSEASDEYKLAQDLAIANALPPHASFSITMGGNDNRRWLTVGPSLWISRSLIGRGTSIWLVAEFKDRQLSSMLMVMKSAWRNDIRLAESTMYDLVQRSHPAIAKFHYGADVKLPDSSAISVNNLRGAPDSQENTPIFHRLSLATVGRPLWNTRDDLQLFKGFRAAFHGHKLLSDQSILHRDISAGNILLSADASPVFGGEGFLTDLGAVISGTVQFMAVQVMAAVINEQPIQQEVRHDIESFVWVLCYVIARRLVYQTLPSKIAALVEKTKNESDEMDVELEQLQSDQTQASDDFHNFFGRTSLKTIRTIRKSLEPISQLYEAPYAKRHLTETTRSLFKSITLMMADHIHRKQMYLTYESLGKVFDAAISQSMQ